MKSIKIEGSKREIVGKKATKALRNADKVPCVLYGGNETISFTAEEKAFKSLVYTPNVYTAELSIDGTKHNAVLQDIQFHPVTDKILHIDFYQISEGKAITMEIPVKLTGKSKGVVIGGALRHNMRKVKVSALLENLPDLIEIDITELAIGGRITIADIKSDAYEIMEADNSVIVQVRMSRNATEDEEESTEESTDEAAATTEA
ncbi:MAG: 50S ribosomal protein L25/general stress protein Ctc [Flavobacteriaceae bacterium]|nr:50S ribosomal protein L25/general stress protein Ctc [Flavobacteriaceae bacterium]